MPSFDMDSSLFASYKAMLRTDMTPEQRAQLWDFAQLHFPSMAALLQEQFQTAKTETDTRQQDRLTGATFLFLTFINSMMPEPVIVAEDSASPRPVSFPSFGFLKRLT